MRQRVEDAAEHNESMSNTDQLDQGAHYFESLEQVSVSIFWVVYSKIPLASTVPDLL